LNEAHVVSFDYKQCVTLPNEVHKSGMNYFKRNININFFGVVSENFNENNNFIYYENNGGKSSNEIITILLNYIKRIQPIENLIFYCDNTVSQNKNRFIICFCDLLMKLNLTKSVRVKFLVVGHTHFNPDKEFGSISNIIKYKDFYTVEKLNDIINNSNFKSTIYQQFYDYKNYFNNLYKQNFKEITNYAEFCIHQQEQKKIYLSKTLLQSTNIPQLNYYESFFYIEYTENDKALELQSKININKNKKKDIKELIQKGIVPHRYADYYYKTFDLN